MELAARAAVLLACAGAAGGLLTVLARSAPHPGGGGPAAGYGPLPGVLSLALGALILVAGGSAVTGAGTMAGSGPIVVLQGTGIGILAAAGLLAARSTRIPSAAPAGAASIVSLAWLGAGTALRLAARPGRRGGRRHRPRVPGGRADLAPAAPDPEAVRAARAAEVRPA